jgi:indole-3-glycerol phosphate synthase
MILDTIVAKKREEVSLLKSRGIHLPAQFAHTPIDSPRGFRQALIDYPGVAIIAEVKKASPSKGVICHDFDPVLIARGYEDNGAQAISVLTDEQFFQGSLLYLLQVREEVRLPVLRKEFIIDEVQIDEAHVYGADAILLMASILDRYQLQEYQACAFEYGIDSLVEVHDERELEMVMGVGVTLIGVNNRNLKDFSMDIETTFRLKKLIPSHIPVVGESGLKTRDDLHRLENEGIRAALIGESLMRGSVGGNTLCGLRGR